MGELIDFGLRVSKLLDPVTVERIVTAAGMAAKDAVLEAADRDLGSDRAFSGLRSKRTGKGRSVGLSVGFDDVGNSLIRLNFRPRGLWMLAEKGRRSGLPIKPRRSRGGKTPPHPTAVLTPEGWRARSSTGHWGGKGTYSSAVRRARIEAPRAARKQFKLEVAKVVR